MAVHVGDRFYNQWKDEYFTVVGIADFGEKPVAYLQYEEGMPSVEPVAALEDRFDKLDPEYVNNESRPRFVDACSSGHVFNGTGEVPKCENCALSAGVLGELLGHSVADDPPSFCASCGQPFEDRDTRQYGNGTLICDDCWEEYST